MSYNITHFSVGNGNCSMIEADNFLMIIDLNKTSDKNSSYDLLKPFFRQIDGKNVIDVLCITHGDEDHCLGFKKFKKEIDSGNLIIGAIWHQGYDREKYHDPSNDPALPEDYIELNKEIKRRQKSKTRRLVKSKDLLKQKIQISKLLKVFLVLWI